MMGRVVTIRALGIQIRLSCLDEHHPLRRHMCPLQIEDIALSDILDLARFALRVLEHALDELRMRQRFPFLRVVVESGLNRLLDRCINLCRCNVAYPKRILGCFARVEWVMALARGCGPPLDQVRIDHQRSRRVEYRHGAIVDHHDVFALTVDRNNLIIYRMDLSLVANVGSQRSVARFHRLAAKQGAGRTRYDGLHSWRKQRVQQCVHRDAFSLWFRSRSRWTHKTST